jgi:hypothetical protein
MTFNFNVPQPNLGNLPSLRPEFAQAVQGPAREQQLRAARAQERLVPGQLKQQQQQIEATELKLEELRKTAVDPDAITEQDLQQFEVLSKVFGPQLQHAAETGDVDVINKFNESVAKLPVFKKVFGEGFVLDEIDGKIIQSVDPLKKQRMLKNLQTQVDAEFLQSNDPNTVRYLQAGDEVIPVVPQALKDVQRKAALEESTLKFDFRNNIIKDTQLSTIAKAQVSAGAALEVLNQLKDNPAAIEIFKTQLVKLSGDVGNIADKERQAIAGSQRLDRLLNRLQDKFFTTGTLPQEDINDFRKVFNGLATNSKNVYTNRLDSLRDSALAVSSLKTTQDSISKVYDAFSDPNDLAGLLEGSARTLEEERIVESPSSLSFSTVEEAEAANLPVGTVVIINGKRAVVE